MVGKDAEDTHDTWNIVPPFKREIGNVETKRRKLISISRVVNCIRGNKQVRPLSNQCFKVHGKRAIAGEAVNRGRVIISQAHCCHKIAGSDGIEQFGQIGCEWNDAFWSCRKGNCTSYVINKRIAAIGWLLRLLVFRRTACNENYDTAKDTSEEVHTRGGGQDRVSIILNHAVPLGSLQIDLTMKSAVILNPAAGNGRAAALEQKLAGMLREANVDARVMVSRSGDHAMTLATEATTWADTVTAVGGDGTIHHVAKGILAGAKPVPLGLIPFGTGNDFIKMTGTPVHIESAIKILAKGKRKAVDYGTVTYQSTHGAGASCFFNTLGIGFDAAVGDRASSYKALPGFGAYLAALLKTLFTLQYADVTVSCDHKGSTPFFVGRMLLSSVGNGSTSGGLFKLTPDASIEDGWFDVCVIEQLSVPRLLASVPRVLRGRHTSMREYHAGKAKHILIEVGQTMSRVGEIGNPGLPVHADGEILAPDVSRLEVTMIKNGISVIVP